MSGELCGVETTRRRRQSRSEQERSGEEKPAGTGMLTCVTRSRGCRSPAPSGPAPTSATWSWASTVPAAPTEAVRDALDGTVEAIVSVFSELIGLWPDSFRDSVAPQYGRSAARVLPLTTASRAEVSTDSAKCGVHQRHNRGSVCSGLVNALRRQPWLS